MTTSQFSFAGTFAKEMSVATRAARAAGEVVMRYHGGALEVELKDGDEPVTAADRESSALICEALASEFPGDIVISEENPDDLRRIEATRVWYVDPIDGTRDFVRGEDGFCVMIGLVLEGKPALGVVHQPLHDVTYLASPGAGAWRQSGLGSPLEPLSVSDETVPSGLRLLVSKSHRDSSIDAIKRAVGIGHEHRVGSIGLKLGLLATGSHDLYVTFTNKCSTWDTAAPAAILAEAGGLITDVRGKPLRYDCESVKHESGLLASNGAVHESVVTALEPIFSI